MKRLAQFRPPAAAIAAPVMAACVLVALSAYYSGSPLVSLGVAFVGASVAALLIEARIRGMAEAITRIASGDRFADLPQLGNTGILRDLAVTAESVRQHLVETDAAAADERSRQQEARLQHSAREFFTRRFRETMEEVLDTFAAAAEQIGSTSAALSEQNRNMRSRIDAATATARSAARDIEGVAAAAQALLEILAKTAEQVASARGASNQTAGDLERADRTVRGLTETALKIDEIIKLIQSIADSTSLLALNAHIEAARAGDAGRGFAVVANEVKTLSGQSAKATEDVSKQVHGIQAAVRNTVDSIEEVTTGVAAINDANRLLAGTLERQIAELQSISRLAVDVAGGVREALPTIEKTAKGVEESGAAVFRTTQHLQERSRSIMDSIAGYFTDLESGSIKIGILHALSGTMTASERPLQLLLVSLIERLNAEGGLLGRPVEAVIMNPRADLRSYAEHADELLTRHRVAAIFGCWSSASRKQVLPVVEKANGLLFYPSQYEGEEQSPNIVYTGGTPRQQALPAVDYLRANGSERFFLIGTDDIYPRRTNAILQTYLARLGVRAESVVVCYTIPAEDRWESIVKDIRQFAGTGGAAVISTVTGDANLSLFRALQRASMTSARVPVVSLTMTELEVMALPRAAAEGHYIAWNYLCAVNNPENARFVADWRAFTGNREALTNDSMEATWVGFHLWVQAVRTASSTNVDAVRAALAGATMPAPSGFAVRLDADNQHLHRPAMIGRITRAGSVIPVWLSSNTLPPDPWSSWLHQERGASHTRQAYVEPTPVSAPARAAGG